MTVAVAGATGALGREVVRQLAARGMTVRAFGRGAARLAALPAQETRLFDLRPPGPPAGACEGVNALILCAGASMRLGGWRDRISFHEADYLGNLRLLAEAKRSGVERLVYVSLAGALAVRHTAFAQAHERFVQALEASGIPACVVRPTGLFHVFAALLRPAAWGAGIVTGHGQARTNPIHEADAARACLEALECRERQMIVGGPEIFTRERLAELPFEALGRPPRVWHVPASALRAAAVPLGWANPRLGALLAFGAAAGEVDLTAPAYGTRRLGDYLRERAATLGAERAPA